MIGFWKYFSYGDNNDMKIIIPFIKYLTSIFFLTGLTVSCVDKKISFKRADDTGVTQEAKKVIVSANNKFALDLYSYLSSKDSNENIFFSPYSIFTAMAMAYEGASGQTANEIQSVFYFPENHSVRRPAIANIYNQLNKPKIEYKLLTANALWIQENLQSKTFKEIQKYYGAEVFMNTSARRINEWIGHKTMNKFKNVVQECPPILNGFCGLSLINTIYFKGDWDQKFKKRNTKKRPFIINEKEKVKVPMMNTTEVFNYMETDTMQILEIPYKSKMLSMLVLLPKDFKGKSEKKENRNKNFVTDKTESLKKSDLISLEKTLTVENFKHWRKTLFKKKVKIYIPKFTFTKAYNLSKTLKQYMPLAFDKKKANFLKFSENIKQLYIKDITHKAFIDVNEKGTEAAAVTVITKREPVSVPPPPPVFKADHPFIFLIQERETGQILFIGRVVNPNTK